jgi:GNAT superfamily N-acetyltransferase
VDIHLAGRGDVGELARLLWLHASRVEQAQQSVDAFATDLDAWWTGHRCSYVAFLARLAPSEVVGMAWLALVPRVPRPGVTSRRSADIQSVFVMPEQRGRGIGSALVQAATEHAAQVGAGRVTVNSGRRAVPLYERLGFKSSGQLLQRPTE